MPPDSLRTYMWYLLLEFTAFGREAATFLFCFCFLSLFLPYLRDTMEASGFVASVFGFKGACGVRPC